jgi:DMSO/TMAO reductase YedYZ heme-binding membrane subunit
LKLHQIFMKRCHTIREYEINFGKYFAEDGRLNLQSEVAMAVGVVALFFLMAPAITTLPMMPKALGGKRWKRGQRAGYIALILVVVHLVFLGLKGWMAPKGWPSMMPPISLIAVIAALTPILTKGIRVREQQKKNEQNSTS